MKRYFWILMTMATRPLFWVLAAAAILVTGGSIHFYSNKAKTEPATIIRAGNIIESQQALLDLAEHPSATPVQIRFDRIANGGLFEYSPANDQDGKPSHITVEETDAYFQEEIEALPIPENVEAITTGSWGARLLPRMGELKSLKRLEILHGSTPLPMDLTPLSNLQELQVLRLGYLHHVASLSPLQQLPKLHTLEINHVDLVKKDLMAQVAKLPALKTLYLPDVTKFDFSFEAIGELNQSASLQTVFLPVTLDEPQSLKSIQSELPNIGVHPNRFRPYRLLISAAMIWSALIASMLGMHFASQFQMPQSQLVPGYQSAHQFITWGIIGTLLLLLAVGGCVLLGGAHWWPSVSAVGLALVAGIRSSVVAMRALRKPSRLDILTRFGFLAVCMAMILVSIKKPLWVEEFLMAQHPLLTTMLSVCTIVAAVLLRKNLRVACRERYAAGIPLVISVHDMQKVATQRSTEAQIQKPLANAYDRTRWWSLAVSSVLLFVILLRYALNSANVANFFTTHPIVIAQLSLATLFLVTWTSFLIAIKWWQKMPFLARMVPRPPMRNCQIDGVFRGVGKDFAVQNIPVTLVVVALAAFAPFWPDGGIVFRAATCALFSVSMIALLYAGTIWSLLIRNALGVFLFAIVAKMVVVSVIAVLTVGGADLNQGLPLYRVVLTSALSIAAAFFAVQAAKRRFLRLEWARMM